MPRLDQPHLSYRFDDVIVDRNLFRVSKGDQPKKLEPRAFDLLIYLIEHRDRVVGKQELFEEVWKESFVTDDALAQEIKNIRHAIGDEAGSSRYIRTVHKHGYRFIADVIEEHKAAVRADSMPSIAVLPFANLTAAPENEYFCDGLAEELLNALTGISDLRVVARTSAFSFKHQQLDVREIGRRLNAATVLEGSVQKTGNQLRIRSRKAIHRQRGSISPLSEGPPLLEQAVRAGCAGEGDRVLRACDRNRSALQLSLRWIG
jgi:DNA-binding winged helix-turn-helix (wHTH) protein